METNNKLREALDDIIDKIDTWRSEGSMEHWQYSQLFDIADAALAEPPRECDRFADEKWADALHAAFIEYCNGCDCPMGCDHRKNPRFLLDGNCASILKCFARFALSKATPKEGGAK